MLKILVTIHGTITSGSAGPTMVPHPLKIKDTNYSLHMHQQPLEMHFLLDHKI